MCVLTAIVDLLDLIRNAEFQDILKLFNNFQKYRNILENLINKNDQAMSH